MATETETRQAAQDAYKAAMQEADQAYRDAPSHYEGMRAFNRAKHKAEQAYKAAIAKPAPPDPFAFGPRERKAMDK
jgi:hypothetical protein